VWVIGEEGIGDVEWGFIGLDEVAAFWVLEEGEGCDQAGGLW